MAIIPQSFQADGLPVLIGSLPLAGHGEALAWIFEATPHIPLWPQLPGLPLERMLCQFAEGLPCIIEENIHLPEGRIRFDTQSPDFENGMLAFYEEYLTVSENPGLLASSRFRLSRGRGEGLYLLGDTLAGQEKPVAVKGQITGPFTMLTGIKDKAGRAGYFDETIRDMVIKGMAMKAAWQTAFLARHSGTPILLFIDEPALASLGSSAFIGVGREEVRDMINEVAAAIRAQGGLTGIHVCANTDWEVLLGSDIDILSFDAYGFFDKLAPLREAIDSFLGRGAILAWGGIPTSREEDILREDAMTLSALWEQHMESLAGPGRDNAALLRQTLITPSCGTGSLRPETARRVLDLTREVSLRLRQKFL